MNALRMIILVVSSFHYFASPAYSADLVELNLTIAVHAKQVVFGDPLYVEVRVENRGRQDVVATPAIVHGDRFRFEFRDPETGLILQSLDADGEPSPKHFKAGMTAVFHQYVFLPGLRGVDHIFWRSFRRGAQIQISGVYRLTAGGLEVRSTSESVFIQARKQSEIDALLHWRDAEVSGYQRGPHPGYFGIAFQRPLSREQVQQANFEIAPSGELGGLLELTGKMQDLYASDPQSRQAANSRLAQWLQMQPDIKRITLIKTIRNIANGYNMSDTVKVLGHKN